MIIRSLGPVVSFKISPPILLSATIFILAYIIISIIVINKYGDLRFANAELDRTLARKQREVEQKRSGLRRYRRRIASLEKQINAIEKRRGRQERTDEKEESLPRIATGGSAEPGEEGTSRGIVDIRDLVFVRDESKATVRFKLLKIKAGNNPVDGYVHVIADNGRQKPDRIWAFPPQALRNGAPLSYRKGRRFRIRRFVPILGKFELSAEGEGPVALRVLIYDRSGQVIFDREYDVGSS
jgi:hypothetical protein